MASSSKVARPSWTTVVSWPPSSNAMDWEAISWSATPSIAHRREMTSSPGCLRLRPTSCIP
ncbi:Uncharacterised protein [Mycobacteroides abscessus subsp. abscessus]|nr:Uncharacterised protein [Mycobacteroides abscessus subsp. abscessus]